jgi:hypothetical protein
MYLPAANSSSLMGSIQTPASSAALASFLDAIRAQNSLKPTAAATVQVVTSSLKLRQRARQGDMLAGYDGRIVRDANGRVIDGREAFLAKLISAEFAREKNTLSDNLANRVWARFIAEADLSRPKGSNPRQRWSLKDARVKARSICRRKPDLKAPRRSRGGHPASHLHAFRKSGFWTETQREMHLTEVGRRITTTGHAGGGARYGRGGGVGDWVLHGVNRRDRQACVLLNKNRYEGSRLVEQVRAMDRWPRRCVRSSSP